MHWEWSMKLLWFIVLAFDSWITLVSCNALGVALHIGIRDGQWTEKLLVTIVLIMILSSFQGWKILTTTIVHMPTPSLGMVLIIPYNSTKNT